MQAVLVRFRCQPRPSPVSVLNVPYTSAWLKMAAGSTKYVWVLVFLSVTERVYSTEQGKWTKQLYVVRFELMGGEFEDEIRAQPLLYNNTHFDRYFRYSLQQQRLSVSRVDR